MDEEKRKKINAMWKKYSDNKDVQFLLLELGILELKLRDADVMAMCVDIITKKGLLDHRSLINDARLEYGIPEEYEFAKEDYLQKYKERKDLS